MPQDQTIFSERVSNGGLKSSRDANLNDAEIRVIVAPFDAGGVPTLNAPEHRDRPARRSASEERWSRATMKG